MSESDFGAYVFLGALGLLFASLIGFRIYWGISTHLTWASRIRRLLEQEGFTVKQMERRWLTTGPFTDMRPPGTKFHKEWLIRLVTVDREHRPRSGWVRWRRAWPWEAADTWVVRWDEAPWLGQWDGETKGKGLSTGVFLVPVFAVSLAGAIGGVAFVVPSVKEKLLTMVNLQAGRTGGDPGPRSEPPGQPAAYEIRCRGGGDAYRMTQPSWERRTERGVEIWRVLLSLEFAASSQGAGSDGTGLAPGTCAWIDRPLSEQEPRVIRFEAPALLTADMQKVIGPLPGTFPSEEELRDPTRFWRFTAFNTNQGFLRATHYGRLSSPEAEPGPAPARR